MKTVADLEALIQRIHEEAGEKGQIKLGAFIAALEAVDDKTKSVQFDFGGFVPDSIMSYRGYYDHLSFDWVERGNGHTVARILVEAKSALGKVFTGYKGGNFVMHENTPLWAAQYGDCHSTAIIGVTEHEYTVVINTTFIP